MDEKSQIQDPDRSQPVLPMMSGMTERRSPDHARHGTPVRAFSIADGTVISEIRRRHHRAAKYLELLRSIDDSRARYRQRISGGEH